jgi:hypothetical protein
MTIKFYDPLHLEIPERPILEEGWAKPCGFDDHQWGIELEDGRARLVCLDPCDLDNICCDPNGPLPTCAVRWEAEDLVTSRPIPVTLEFVDDSTPSTPNGPAEFGFWIEVHPK